MYRFTLVMVVGLLAALAPTSAMAAVCDCTKSVSQTTTESRDTPGSKLDIHRVRMIINRTHLIVQLGSYYDFNVRDFDYHNSHWEAWIALDPGRRRYQLLANADQGKYSASLYSATGKLLAPLRLTRPSSKSVRLYVPRSAVARFTTLARWRTLTSYLGRSDRLSSSVSLRFR